MAGSVIHRASCPYGPVAARRAELWQPTHPPDWSLQPTQGRCRRSPPRSCPAPSRGRLRPLACGRPGRSRWGLHRRVGACQTGPLQPRPRRHDRLARHPPSRPIRGLGRRSPGRGHRPQAARVAGAAGFVGRSHGPGRGAGRRLVGAEVPAAPRNAVQHHVSRLRAALGAESIVAAPDGYALVGATVDALRFEELLARPAAPGGRVPARPPSWSPGRWRCGAGGRCRAAGQPLGRRGGRPSGGVADRRAGGAVRGGAGAGGAHRGGRPDPPGAGGASVPSGCGAS